ncbi:hypothetical protein INT44_005384 [Umbelopsis vinacea]|uniref:Uncharacterized protein n=1 Tax=Umbelopsis vinacea TaxID=44442 RepID=A0A8H7Q737_9FUNG|nr:hypothetical protein INT44_005384 [Umbelopsis vinacea]
MNAEDQAVAKNPMRELRLEKLVLNICVAHWSKPVHSKTRYTARAFGIRRNEKISVHVTVHGAKDEKLLERGLKEHIDHGIKYDPSIRIYGMNFFCVMGRPGYRDARRRRCKSTVGTQHKAKTQQTVEWYKSRFDGLVLNK